jgi:hypothetical protein
VVREAARLDRLDGREVRAGDRIAVGIDLGVIKRRRDRRSNFSEMWCSSRSASSWTSAQS